MTFIINSDGKNSTIDNTAGTDASFGSGSIKMNAKFINSGNVRIDARANLEVSGDVINSGNFEIRDYITEEKYSVIQQAIDDLSGNPKENLEATFSDLQLGNEQSANNHFKQFFGYIKEHPELITSSVQILLSLFTPTP